MTLNELQEPEEKEGNKDREIRAGPRHCPHCGKRLSELNRGPKCFACTPAMVVDIDRKGRIFRRPSTFKVMELVTVCSSRETRGFNRVYVEYHGWANGL